MTIFSFDLFNTYFIQISGAWPSYANSHNLQQFARYLDPIWESKIDHKM